MSTFELEETLYTLRPSNYIDNLLRLDGNGHISATAHEYETDMEYVYFYVVPVGPSIKYQFRPYSDSDKYIAVIDGKVALKTKDECKEEERSFCFDDSFNTSLSFYVSTDKSTYYLGCKSDKKLCACMNEDDRTWFYLQEKEDKIIAETTELFFETNSSAEMIIFKEE